VHLEVATTEGAHDGTVAAIRQAFLGIETSPKVFLPVFSGGFRFYAVAKLGNIPNPIPYAHQGHQGDYLHPEQCVTLLSTSIPLRGVKAARAGQTLGALLTQCGVVWGQNLLAIGCMDDRFFINVAEAADARSIQTFMMKCQSTLRLVHQARVLGWEVQIEGDRGGRAGAIGQGWSCPVDPAKVVTLFEEIKKTIEEREAEAKAQDDKMYMEVDLALCTQLATAGWSWCDQTSVECAEKRVRVSARPGGVHISLQRDCQEGLASLPGYCGIAAIRRGLQGNPSGKDPREGVSTAKAFQQAVKLAYQDPRVALRQKDKIAAQRSSKPEALRECHNW
jgi:hypothetical protein